MSQLPRFYILERSAVERDSLYTIRHVYTVVGGNLYSETKVWREQADQPPKLVLDQARELVGGVTADEAETLDRLFQNCGYVPVSGAPGQLSIPA